MRNGISFSCMFGPVVWIDIYPISFLPLYRCSSTIVITSTLPCTYICTQYRLLRLYNLSAWYDPITSNYLVLVSLEWLHTGYPSQLHLSLLRRESRAAVLPSPLVLLDNKFALIASGRRTFSGPSRPTASLYLRERKDIGVCSMAKLSITTKLLTSFTSSIGNQRH